jgi:hypothetical protein
MHTARQPHSATQPHTAAHCCTLLRALHTRTAGPPDSAVSTDATHCHAHCSHTATCIAAHIRALPHTSTTKSHYGQRAPLMVQTFILVNWIREGCSISCVRRDSTIWNCTCKNFCTSAVTNYW